ncbi:MAG: glycosyltransferase [Pseudomonadota bacterium]
MPLRILVLTPGLPGGMERVFEHLNSALEQERADFCLHFFTTHGPLWKSLLLFLPRLFYFTILVTFKKFDVCHINLAWGGSTYRKIAYGMLCRWLSLPYVIHLHGSRFREYFLGSSAAHQKRIEKFFQGADKVIVLGTPWRDFIHEKLCVPLDDVVILPNAVQGPHHFPLYKEHAKKHILFLGQLGERKGTKDLVNALSNPKLKHLSWSATLAGDGQVAKI